MRKFLDILKRVLGISLTPDEKKLFVNTYGRTILSTVYLDVSYINQI